MRPADDAPVVTLRPQRPADLALLVGGDTKFDDFGPLAPSPHPAPSRLDDAGALTVGFTNQTAGTGS